MELEFTKDGDIELTNAGIKYMENKPKEFFEDLSKLFDLVAIIF